MNHKKMTFYEFYDFKKIRLIIYWQVSFYAVNLLEFMKIIFFNECYSYSKIDLIILNC